MAQTDTDEFESNEKNDFIEKAYENHRLLMLKIANGYFRNDPCTAEDVVQNSFFVMYKHYDKMRDLDENGLRNYISCIVKSVSLNTLKKLKSVCGKNVLMENAIDVAGSSVDIQCDFLSKLNYENLVCLISNLSETLKDVAHLYLAEGWSHDEISEKLGISCDASKQRLSRARKELKNKIASSDS